MLSKSKPWKTLLDLAECQGCRAERYESLKLVELHVRGKGLLAKSESAFV
jgi:hypothetical protein